MNYLTLVALYALLHVFVPKPLEQRSAEEVNTALSTNAPFGVFVTLTRDKKVHGCIGNWSTHFQPVSGATVVDWVQQVTYNARHNDSRRLQFSKDLNEDLTTEVEINIMLLPVVSVDLNDTSFFNNREYGLIVEGSGRRAAYLPGVFPESSFSNISQSLLEKAGLESGTDGHGATFYAYKTHVVTFQLYKLLFSTRTTYYLQQDVAAFYHKYFTDFVPYEFNSKTREVSVSPNEAVRNVSCLVDVLALSTRFNSVLDLRETPLLDNLNFYFQKWFKYQEDLTQASIFLLRAYSLLHEVGTNVQKRVALLEDGLYEVLLTLEPQFAMGEAVSTLAPLVNAGAPSAFVNKLFQACSLMRSRLDTSAVAVHRFRKRRTWQLNWVFELNWQSQSAHKMLQLSLSTFPDQVPFLEEMLHTLVETVVPLVSHHSAEALETNYLAVIYECLSHLEAALQLLGQSVPESLLEQKLKFYATLLESRRGGWGLFYFKDSAVARLDLTGHTLLINL